MNVASYELCYELYGLSAWYSSSKWWMKVDGDLLIRDEDDEGDPICPAYNLGYLLSKLPEHWPGGLARLVIQSPIPSSSPFSNPTRTEYLRRGSGTIGVWEIGYTKHNFVGDKSLQDAACKLAIELFKQGILKKE